MTKKTGWTSVATLLLLAGILVVLAYATFLNEPRFEYRTRFVGDWDQETPKVLESMLDAMGAEGWELVSFNAQHWHDDLQPTTVRVSLRRRVR